MRLWCGLQRLYVVVRSDWLQWSSRFRCARFGSARLLMRAYVTEHQRLLQPHLLVVSQEESS